MNLVHFIVIAPETGAILRHGYCVADDASLQGALVRVFEDDPQMTGRTHRYDLITQTFEAIES